ncbi:hypothetical protein [Corynebacterium frankenforstense]
MEDMFVKALKSTARRGGVICATALTALALASCSAGQITQTSSQVAAVDGASADAEDGSVAVRDVTVVLDGAGNANLKFVAVNQDTSQKDHRLESVEVDGQQAPGFRAATIDYPCSLVSDTEAAHDRNAQAENAGCIEYTETELDGDYAVAGNVDVTFKFDSGDITVTATVSEQHPEAGQFERGTGDPADNHE